MPALKFDRAHLEKPIRFGIYGGLGCFVLALVLGELFHYLLMPGKQEAEAKQPSMPPPPPVDILFVLDVTASMQQAIDGVRDGIVSFANDLDKQGLDPRIGLIAFRDIRIGEREQILTFDDGPFTRDYKAFSARVGRLSATGGGDIPESSLDALVLAAKQPFRKEAAKVIVLITDAPPHLPDELDHSAEDVGILLKQSGIDQLTLVVERRHRRHFEPVQSPVGGKFFSLAEAERGETDYKSLLPQIGKEAAEAARAKQPGAKGLQSTEEFTPRSELQLTIATAVWTALLAAGIALALIIGQNYYLKRNLLTRQEGLRGGLGAAACGLIAGVVGQGLFLLADTDSSFVVGLLRVLGWTVLGALLGLGMSYFVKNLRIDLAAAGGAAGGFFGAVFFMIASALFGDVPGRLLGAFLLGFGIGVMVALVEIAFRKAWLEVRYGPREIIAVNLGPEPIKVGGDGRACTVWARGAAPLAYRFWIREGKVVCDDVARSETREVGGGTRYSVGSIEVVVRTDGGTSEQAAPAPERATAALPSNPRELRSTSPPPPAPVIAKAPIVPKVEAPTPKADMPTAPSPPPPPPPPAPRPPESPRPAEQSTSDNSACPGCGRKVPGLPGQRYCLVCDQSF